MGHRRSCPVTDRHQACRLWEGRVDPVTATVSEGHCVSPRAGTRIPSRLPGRSSRRRRLCVLHLITIFFFVSAALAQSHPTEYAVKAAYLYNFGKFVRWPADSRAGRSPNFSICVIGQDPFGAALDGTVEGENIAGKPAVVRRIASARDATSCNILYISPSERGRLSDILAALGKDSPLTVSDIP